MVGLDTAWLLQLLSAGPAGASAETSPTISSCARRRNARILLYLGLCNNTCTASQTQNSSRRKTGGLPAYDGNAKQLGLALDAERSYEVLAEDSECAPCLLHEIALLPPSGLTQRCPVPLQNLTKNRAQKMIAAENHTIPTAWNAGLEKGRRHYAAMYAHLNPSDYAAKMRKCFASLRHAAVPPYMQDILYKNATSGHVMGFERFPYRTAKGNICDEGVCRRCGSIRMQGNKRVWVGAEETLEHAYDECAEVRTFLEMVIGNWNESMYEEVDASDKRVSLLGDRGEDAKAISEEPWRVVHACIVWAINATRMMSKEEERKPDALTAKAMMRMCRRKLNELVQSRWRAAQRSKQTTNSNKIGSTRVRHISINSDRSRRAPSAEHQAPANQHGKRRWRHRKKLALRCIVTEDGTPSSTSR